MSAVKKVVLILLILCSCVGCDQVTKTVARNHLASSSPVYLVGDVFRLQYTENAGALLGLGAGLPEAVRFWALIVLVGVALIGMLRFVWTSQEMNPMCITGIVLIIGGGFSNLLDRVLRGGAVIDFMNIGIGNVRTGIFNLADLAIMIGVGIMLAWGVFFRDSDLAS
jgi:signal peptidase II